jgi:hypothetical protein
MQVLVKLAREGIGSNLGRTQHKNRTTLRTTSDCPIGASSVPVGAGDSLRNMGIAADILEVGGCGRYFRIFWGVSQIFAVLHNLHLYEWL